jgi:glycine dehydrogenase
LVNLTPPGEMGAAVVLELHNVLVFLDMVVHTPLFFATKEEYKRSMPGRIIGVTVDTDGNRLAYGVANS